MRKSEKEGYPVQEDHDRGSNYSVWDKRFPLFTEV